MTEQHPHDPRFAPPPGRPGDSPAPQFEAFEPTYAAPGFPPPAFPAPAHPAVYPGYLPYAAPRSGRSTAAKIGIVAGIAVGALVVLSIVVAVAGVVLEHRHDQAVARRTTFTVPDSLEGFPRMSGAVDQLVQDQVAGLPKDWGTPQAAAYGSGTTVQAVVVGGVHPLTAADQKSFLGGFARSMQARGATAATVDPGPLGGRMQCGTGPDGRSTACGFADNGAFGAITVAAVGDTAHDLVLQIRSDVEHRS